MIRSGLSEPPTAKAHSFGVQDLAFGSEGILGSMGPIRFRGQAGMSVVVHVGLGEGRGVVGVELNKAASL